ncbi:MAG: PD-(D/E)XK nuclease family protein [Proteobacteria bacterium]|nr:PD-(D/E)XK nuclease family protein [Pseudomonadota bacterium]
MMDIIFGLWADGGASPEQGGDGPGALGAPVVGPHGLLEILETACGLGAPPVPHVVRVAAYQAALEAAGPRRFWSRSLEADGWATARTLLGWRDTLVDMGWNAGAAWRSPRLTDLAAAEAAAAELPPAPCDRVAALAHHLSAGRPLPVARIRLIDARAHHSPGWRHLFDRLEACGVSLVPIEPAPQAAAEIALGRLQRWMQDGAPLQEGSDGSVTLATCASTALAAEVVGQWLATSGEPDILIVAQEGDTHLLDEALAAAGLPRAGRSRASAHRGALQTLLLAFKVAWAPFEPRALLELLLFPGSPVAQRAGGRLAAAIEDAPGRQGLRWEAAWDRITTHEIERAGDDAAEKHKAEARIARWRSWVEPEPADPVAGMLLADALAICDRVTSWATARHAQDEDPLYGATASIAADVRRALIALGRDRLPRALVERVIDQALDIGHDNPQAIAEASSWRCVPHPGGVWNATGTIIWWNFRSTGEALVRQPWTEAERRELAAAGSPADADTIAASAASAAWERAVMHARSRLIFVNAGLDAEEEEAQHPLAHRLAPATKLLGHRLRLERAIEASDIDLAGTPLGRERLETRALPETRTLWPTPDGHGDKVAALEHSATSFESGLACQLMWALKHVAKLRPGRVRSVPDANQLLGNLAHALAQEIFQPGTPPEADAAQAVASGRLEALIDEMAAPLRLPEYAAHLALARRRLPPAMRALARTLHDNGLIVEASELQTSALFDAALAVRGAIDLVTRDAGGHHVIIDLKWTRRPAKRLDELASGKAVQLATYGAMLADDQPYRAGYFLLNQRQFATLAANGLIGRPVEGVRSLPDTWAAVRDSWGRLADVANGSGLVAGGLEGSADHLPADLPILLEANCRWCDYQTICRTRGLS